ncbi:MAG: aminotransferase class I/II-fold pyridoxal phosphate-dependent enzyme [Azospirillaceae bacterium]
MAKPDFTVSLAHDGPEPTPRQMAERLAQLTADGSVESDYYGNGGAVAAFEARIADFLGKERAVIFPTGTLANLMGMRLLAGTSGGRVVVHRLSHLFNDSGENLSLLGGFTMVPLDDRGPGYSAEALAAEIARAADARIATRIGCVAIESPARRSHGARFPMADREAVIALAREHGIPLFLDAARMPIEAAYAGVEPQALAAPYDLVYMSLYKYLGAPFGCVLAGPRALLDDLYQERRRFGGGLAQMWPAALLAQHHLDGLIARLQAAIPVGEAVAAALAQADGLDVARIPDGTNIFHLRRAGRPFDKARLDTAAAEVGLALPAPAGEVLPLRVNETWTRLPAEEIASRLLAVLAAEA